MTATYINPINTTLMVVMIGNGATPEVFSPKVTINKNRTLSLKATAIASKVTRTDDPTQPAKTTRIVTDVDWDVSGDGSLDAGDSKYFADWLMSGAPKNIQVFAGSATGDLEWAGPVILEEFSLSGAQNGDLVTATIKMSAADIGVSTAHA